MAEWEVDTARPRPETPGVSGEPSPPSSPPVTEPPESSPAAGEPAPGRAGSSRPRDRRRSLYVWTATGLVILIAGMLIGYLIAGSPKDEAAARLDEAQAEVARLQAGLTKAEERNWAYYRANEAPKKRLEQAGEAGSTSTTAVVRSPVPPGSFGDGVFPVGDDIAPGTYEGVVTGIVGYWARLRGTDGSIGAIITNGLPRGPFVLTVEPGDEAVGLRGVVLTPR